MPVSDRKTGGVEHDDDDDDEEEEAEEEKEADLVENHRLQALLDVEQIPSFSV